MKNFEAPLNTSRPPLNPPLSEIVLLRICRNETCKHNLYVFVGTKSTNITSTYL